MKILTYPPHQLSLTLNSDGWHISCVVDSPLADLFNALTPTEQIVPITDQHGNHIRNQYPVTLDLDNSIKTILDMLTAIRYETNKIQLPLLTDDLFKD